MKAKTYQPGTWVTWTKEPADKRQRKTEYALLGHAYANPCNATQVLYFAYFFNAKGKLLRTDMNIEHEMFRQIPPPDFSGDWLFVPNVLEVYGQGYIPTNMPLCGLASMKDRVDTAFIGALAVTKNFNQRIQEAILFGV